MIETGRQDREWTTGQRVDSPEVPGTESRVWQDSGGVTAWTHGCGGNGNGLA